MVRAATVSDAHVHLHYSARKFRNNLIAGISRADDVATQDRQVTVRSGAAENGVRSNGSSAISHHTSDGISSGASLCNRRQSIDSLTQHSTVNGKSSPKSKRKVANVSNTLDGDSIPVKLVCETSSKSSAENSNKKGETLDRSYDMEKNQHSEKGEQNPNVEDNDNFTVVTKRNKRRSKLLNPNEENRPNSNDFSANEIVSKENYRPQSNAGASNRSYFLTLAPATNKRANKEQTQSEKQRHASNLECKDTKKSKLPKPCRKTEKPAFNGDLQHRGETSKVKNKSKPAADGTKTKKVQDEPFRVCSDKAPFVPPTEPKKESIKRLKDENPTNIPVSNDVKLDVEFKVNSSEYFVETSSDSKKHSSKKRKLSKNSQKKLTETCSVTESVSATFETTSLNEECRKKVSDECSRSGIPNCVTADPSNQSTKSESSFPNNNEVNRKSRLPRKLSGKNNVTCDKNLGSKEDPTQSSSIQKVLDESDRLNKKSNGDSSNVPISTSNHQLCVTNSNTTTYVADTESLKASNTKVNPKGSSSIPILFKSKNSASKITIESDVVKEEVTPFINSKSIHSCPSVSKECSPFDPVLGNNSSSDNQPQESNVELDVSVVENVPCQETSTPAKRPCQKAPEEKSRTPSKTEMPSVISPPNSSESNIICPPNSSESKIPLKENSKVNPTKESKSTKKKNLDSDTLGACKISKCDPAPAKSQKSIVPTAEESVEVFLPDSDACKSESLKENDNAVPVKIKSNLPCSKEKKRQHEKKSKQHVQTSKTSDASGAEVANVLTETETHHTAKKSPKSKKKLKSEFLRAEDIDEIVKESFNGAEEDETSVDDNLKAFLNIQQNLTKTPDGGEITLVKSTMNNLSSEETSKLENAYTAAVFNNIKYIDDDSNDESQGLSRNSIISRLRHEFFNSNTLSAPSIPAKPSIIKNKDTRTGTNDAEPKKNVTFSNSAEKIFVQDESLDCRDCSNDNVRGKQMYTITGEVIFERHNVLKFPPGVVHGGSFHSRQSYDPYLEVINEEGCETAESATETVVGPSIPVTTTKCGEPGTQRMQHCRVNVFHSKPVEHVEIIDVGDVFPQTNGEPPPSTVLAVTRPDVSTENILVDIVQTTSLSNAEAVCVTIDSDSDVMTASSIADDDNPPPLASPIFLNEIIETEFRCGSPTQSASGPRKIEVEERTSREVSMPTEDRLCYGYPAYASPTYENVEESLICPKHELPPYHGTALPLSSQCLVDDNLSLESVQACQAQVGCPEASDHIYENLIPDVSDDFQEINPATTSSENDHPLKEAAVLESAQTLEFLKLEREAESKANQELSSESDKFIQDMGQSQNEVPGDSCKNQDGKLASSGEEEALNEDCAADSLENLPHSKDRAVSNVSWKVDSLSEVCNYEEEDPNESCSSDGSDSSFELECFDAYSFHCAERLEQMKDSIVYDFSSDEIEDTKRISGLCEMSNSDLTLTDNCVDDNSVSIEVSSNTALQNPDVNGNPVDGGIDRPTVSEGVTCNGFKSQLTIFPKSTESNLQNGTVSTDHSIYKVMVNDGNPGALKVKHPRNDIVTFQQTNSSVIAALEDSNENSVAPQSTLDTSSVDCGTQSKPEEETALGTIESDVDFDYAISENSALTTIRRDSTKNVVKLESAEEIICSESASSFASASLIPHLQQNSQENLSKLDLSDSRHESSSSNSTTLSTVRHNSSDSIFTANNNDIRPDRINEIPSLKELCLITVLSLPNSLNILENIGLSDLLFENGFNDDDDLEISNEIGNSGGDWCSNPHQQRISSVQLSEATSSSRSGSQKLELEPPPRQTKSQGCNSFVPYRSFSFVQMTSVGTNTDKPNKQDQATDSNSLIEGHSDCEWIGLPTDTHSTILLSPSQYKTYKFPPSPEQNANLLDLHNKFSARRGYHELDWKSAAQRTTAVSSENSPCSPVSSFRPIETSQVSTESNSSFARRNVNDGNTAATLIVDRNAGGRVNRSSGDARRPSDTSMPTESSSTIHQGALKTFLPRVSGLEPDLDSRKQTNAFHLDESTTSPRSIRQHPGVFRGEEVVEARKSSLEVSSNIEPGYSRLLAIVQENANECHSKSALDSTPGCLVRKGASNSNALPESVRFKPCASKSSEVEICETQFSGRAPPVAPSISEESKRCLVQPENMPEQRFEDTAFDVNHGVNGDIHNTFKPASLNVNKYHEIFKKNDGFFGHFDNSKIVCENVILNYDDNSCTEQIINKEKAALGSPKNGNMIGEVNNLQFFNSNGIALERDDVPGKRTEAVDYSDQIQKSIEESRHFFENLSKIKQRNSWNNFRRSSLPNVNELQNEKPKISKQGDFFEISRSQTIFDSKSNQSSRKNSLEPKSQSGENFRQDMYNEYMLKLAERSERRSNKVIKVSQPQALVSPTSSVENGSNWSESKNDLGSEFIKKVRQRMEKYGLDVDESDSKLTDGEATIATTNPQEEENIPSRKGSSNLPKHIQEFLQLSGCQSTVTHHTNFETDFRRSLSLYQEIDNALRGFLSGKGVWSPAVTPEAPRKVYDNQRLEPKNSEKDEKNGNTEPIPPVWTPKSSGRATPSDQITFKPIKFQSPVPARKASKVNKESGGFQSKLPIPTNGTEKKSEEVVGPSVKERISAFSSVSGKRLEIKNQNNNENSKLRSLDHSVLGQCGLALPKSQNPTITLLQKAREGQLSKGAAYLDDQKMYTKETPEKTKTSEPENNQESKAQSKKVMNTEQKPTEKTKSPNADRISSNNVPGGREENQQKWYKRMYESLHQANLDIDRASQQIRNGNSGYSSEPEATNHNSDKIAAKYATLDRRRNQSKENDASLSYVPRTKPSNEALKHAVEIYNSQPGRIENYEPGRCSIADKETKEWWDEMMEIFDKQYGETGGHRNQSNPPSQQKKHFMTYTLKDGGYESDSSLVFKRRDENCDMSPTEKKMAYKEIQKGGEVPLHGLRKPAPQRPKDDSVIEYFPISDHLTKIRVHRSRRSQPIEPLREIICYPVTSIEHSNIQPVFSQFKRSAPPASIAVKKSSEPPSPPKRQSSRRNSMLQLVSKISVSPPKSKTKLVRSSSGIEVDSNVEYLKERLQHKLGVPKESQKKSPSSDFKKSQKIITSCLNFSRSLPSRQKSISPGAKRTVTKPLSKTASLSDGPLSKVTHSSLRSRKDQQEASSKKLYASLDLKSPAEVSKVLNRNYITDQRERALKNSSKYPPGTVVRSSTTYYNSNNPSKLNQDKALKVTVAISAKGRELLKPTTVSSIESRSEMKSLCPKKTASNIILSSRSSVSSKSCAEKSKVSAKNSERKRTVVSKEVVKITSSPSPPASQSLDKSWSSPSVAPKTKVEKCDTPEPLAKKRFKGKADVSKQQSSTEILAEKQSLFKSTTDKHSRSKSPKNGKKKVRKAKSDTESQAEDGKTKKSEGAANNSIHSIDIKIVQTRPPSVSNEPVAFSDLSNDLKHSSLQCESVQNAPQRVAISPTPSSIGSIYRSPSVIERTRSLYKEENKISYKSEPSLRLLNIYLAHKKPVSESKFKSLDQDLRSKISSRSLSPSYSFRRAEFLDKIEKFDVDNVWSRAGSRSYFRHESPPVLKGRSSSEPPMSSPSDDNDSNALSPLCCGLKSALLTSDRLNSSHSRSPSSRRIQSAKSSVKCSDAESESLNKKAGAKKLQKSPLQEKHFRNIKSLSSSSLSQLNDYTDYQAYVLELMHSTKKCERFKELHKFYKNLERLGQLEQTASNNDLRPRLKNEEIIDFDRWQSLRKKEKAEEELKALYRRLKEDQKEKDLVFQPKDIDSFRWKIDRDRGLKSREKSVEDIKQQFYKMNRERSISKSGSFSIERDTYKPLWRGSSVVDLASSLASSTSSRHGRPVSQVERSASTIPRPSSMKYGKYIGSRLWSSLSMDQVNALKSQLNEIYSTVSSLKRERINKMLQNRVNKGKENYEIEVTAVKKPTQSFPEPQDSVLHVRCNSLLTRDQTYSPLVRKKESKRSECMKSNSIGSIPSWKSTGEKPFLSETDKKKISMKLSHEVLDRVTKKNSMKKKRHSGSLVIPRETLGAVASIKSYKKVPSAGCSVSSVSSPRTCYSMEISDLESQHCATTEDNQNNYMLVLKPSHDQEICKESKMHVESHVGTHVVSNSETESGSSDASTVIHLGNRENVEKAKSHSPDSGNLLKTYLNVEESASRSIHLDSGNSVVSRKEKTKENRNVCPSQSFADFKEIFGERQLYQNFPPRSPTQSITSLSDAARPKSLPTVSSEESIFRSRSTTPDPMKYYRAYLNMVKSGDVRKLRDRFESLDELDSHCSSSWVSLKRFQSDPELTRNMLSQNDRCRSHSVRDFESGDVQFLRNKYETITNPRRQRTRYRPISPKSLMRNRYMPHINVISKSASLQAKSRPTITQRPYRTTEIKLPPGAVDRIRRMFEKKPSLSNVSLMGQMYTSAPNIRELNEIAPYLECQWIAHQHPDPTYHARSLSSPDTDSKHSPMYSLKPRPQSASPTRKRQLSILKQSKDMFAQQKFDPSIHQPTFRYQPPTPEYSPRLNSRFRHWRNDPHFWCKYFHSKPTVTFKEPVLREVPSSPSSSPFYSYEPQSESAAGRYAESAVTLQYRRPVLAEVKEALSEDELARRQAEAMQRLYQEERRRKYLQELHDISSRRHTDHFIPSQKSPIPLNRYDDFFPDESPTISRQRDRTPEPILVARALYNFVGQSSRELSFRRGDIIFVRRQIDKNWYEGEHNAMIGLFPINYVEIIPYHNIRTIPKKPTEGQARAKFNFIAQSHLELSLVKGELVVLTRRVDSNWFEGRIGNRRGIFPVSYVEVLTEPGERAFSPVRPTTPATPVTHSSLSNGSSQPIQLHSMSDGSSDRLDGKQDMSLVNQTLHIDTQSDPIPYRALYNYRPQNEDELELQEGDTVYVIEKCDDGWYVGSSQRTGAFGTFPGNYVQRVA